MTGGSGASGSAGAATGGAGGASATGGAGGIGGSMGTAGNAPDLSGLEPFSFFVTSYAAMVRLSGSEKGFGGDLRYGEADGLSGADKICTEIAETTMPGSGAKVWHAFLSVTKGADGTPVNAIDRLGDGPWYDRIGRLLAMNKAALMNTRPEGADPAIIDDFPNEDGVPNHAPDGTLIDNHDFLTGTNDMGQVFCTDATCTCSDWTSAEMSGKPRVGHAWPRNGGPGGVPGGFGGGFAGTDGGFGGTGGMFPGGFDPANWMSSLDEAGCAPGIESTMGMDGPPDPSIPTVGSGGGYGGIYCFAMNP